ncbi:hypothetical protein BN1723_006532 [Verticillium longisporum]|uniref:Cytochrome P450 52A11 n=2 Tax=Verticillium longisporum TaxID=100787 RepID=A0A0G4KCR0_VERLO|nr:hypothetical protein BN1708_000346 [Verticillium longisporum]CRK45305.1 hypothetical protein BN1723_006532 [Verticillium longisporum]
MFTNPWLLGGLGVLALAVYLYQALAYRRLRQFAHLPQIKPSVVWGHLAVLGEHFKSDGTGTTDMDKIFGRMIESIGNPEVMLLDIRPFNHPILFIRTHEVAEQVSKQTKAFPYSFGKPTTMDFLEPLIGPSAIIRITGSHWKDLRRRFNPGFAPQHLMSLLPLITEKTEPLLASLDRLVASGESFTLEPLLTGLTFDIIGAVTMGIDFNAQLPDDKQSEFIRMYRELLFTYKGDDGGTPAFAQPLKRWRRRRMAKRVDAHLSQFVRDKYNELKREGRKSRTVLALSLQDEDHVSDAMISETIDQLKSFMFAGHDTTSILLQWALYELSRTPRALKTLRAELADLFGSDATPETVRAAFEARGDDIMPKMTYTSAVIKEALRLYPPAGTARWCPPGSNFHLKLADGSSLCVDGTILYNCHTLIQRDEAVYGPTVNDFVPERWLGNTNTSMSNDEEEDSNDAEKATIGKASESDIPVSAWRPFERGPRNCIGQELANIEARIILATVVVKYDFVKVGMAEAKLGQDGKPLLDDKGQHVSDTQLFSDRQITARPNDGIEVRVKLREGLRP